MEAIVVDGVNLGVVDASLMRLTAKNFAVDLGDDEDPGRMVRALAKKFNDGGEDLLECTNCKGWSPVSLSSCPFCGEHDLEEEDEQKLLPPKEDDAVLGDEVMHHPALPAGSPIKEMTLEDVALSVQAEDDAAEDAKAKKKAEKAAAKEAAKLAAREAKEAAKLARKPKLPPEPTRALAIVERKTEPIELASGVPVVLATDKDLDIAVEEINALKGQVLHSAWLLGKRLTDVFVTKLYLQRKTAEGKVAYKSWEGFVHAELGMSAGCAYGMMKLARSFTSDQVTLYGRAKLALVVKVPEDDRPQLLEQIENGATYDEVREEVKQLRQEHGAPPPEPGRKVMPKGDQSNLKGVVAKEAAKEAPAQDRVTVAVLLKKVVVPLFKKGDHEKRAKRLADEPEGKLELANRVVAKVRLRTNAAGELEAVLDFKRVDAA